MFGGNNKMKEHLEPLTIERNFDFFVSHKWNNKISDEETKRICEQLVLYQINPIVDKYSLKYGESIVAFMDGIKKCNGVILLICNDYFFSINCMYEGITAMKDCKNKEATYEVLSYMLEDENVKKYLNAQSAVPCKKGDFEITPELEEMRDYIENGIVADYQDHHYPSEMSVDAMIQTYLMDDSADATDTFMKRFDKEWIRYNRDVVAKVKAYEEGNDHE